MNEFRFETLAIHAGQKPEPVTGAVVVPIFQTSTYAQEDVGKARGYEYSRTDNPTRKAFEECLASLEGGKYGLGFGSGMAAISACMYLLSPGDHVIVSDDVYGGTYRLFASVQARYGLEFDFIDTTQINLIKKSTKPNTKMIWIETPTNPMLKLCDIEQIASWVKSKNIISAVDNTFMTPYFQKPLSFGIDIVAHSCTKYLGGHSDVVSGAVVTSDEKIYEVLKFHQNAVGAVPGPFDCWLVLRGMKTLSCRMRDHEANAVKIAKFLEAHPKVSKVIYPGLSNHPQHELARKQMTGFGGMITFVIKGGLEDARTVLRNTKLFTLAESLGGVESLIEHPAIMTHASLPKERREELGISDGLIRISAGIENGDDLVEDLASALDKIPQHVEARG